MKKLSKNKKGFSLMEVIVAMFIFAIMMTATAAFFGKSMFSYRSAKAIQKDLESAQFAMNLAAKSLRTSSVVNFSTTYIEMYNYSQGKCIKYQFDNVNKKLQSGWATPATPDDKSTCDFLSIVLSDMATSTVTGLFNIISSAPNVAGKVTISIKVCPESGCSGNPKDEANIQSTVSLRDYKEAGL